MSRRIIVILAAACALSMLGCTREQFAEVRTYSGINQIRENNGEPDLHADPELSKLARVRSADMAANDYFSHFPPNGCDFACLIDGDKGSHEYAGENLAWNLGDWGDTADVAVRMWFESPPHLENILGCHYERFGTGVVQAGNGKIYYTMLFEGNHVC